MGVLRLVVAPCEPVLVDDFVVVKLEIQLLLVVELVEEVVLSLGLVEEAGEDPAAFVSNESGSEQRLAHHGLRSRNSATLP